MTGSPTESDRDAARGPLPAWQWSLYAGNHTTRGNLLIHVLTVPVFQLGTLTLLGAPLTALSSGPVAAAASAVTGLVMMAGAMALQGRGHKGEPVGPVPFRGPGDVVSRIFLEQWFTFPRYVLSGAFSRAWGASTPA